MEKVGPMSNQLFKHHTYTDDILTVVTTGTVEMLGSNDIETLELLSMVADVKLTELGLMLLVVLGITELADIDMLLVIF